MKTLKINEDIDIETHLNIIQSIIQRMASNSASCKSWCITIVSAILVIIGDKGQSQLALIAIIPTLLFFILDTYYLSLEKMFRKSYNIFIKKVHKDKLKISDFYSVKPTGCLLKEFGKSIFSFSILPFYTIIIIMIFILKNIIS